MSRIATRAPTSNCISGEWKKGLQKKKSGVPLHLLSYYLWILNAVFSECAQLFKQSLIISRKLRSPDKHNHLVKYPWKSEERLSGKTCWFPPGVRPHSSAPNGFEVIRKRRLLVNGMHWGLGGPPHYTGCSCTRHADQITEPAGNRKLMFSNRWVGRLCRLRQVAAGGDTGDDAGQRGVSAGSAQLYKLFD